MKTKYTSDFYTFPFCVFVLDSHANTGSRRMRGEIGIHQISYTWENITDSAYLTDDELMAETMN